jgi:hypothetical protein
MTARQNIKTELTFYGLNRNQITRPNWNTIATQLGVRPTTQRYANINDNSAKNRKIYKDFVRQVKTNIREKYTSDNENIIQSYSYTGRIRYKTGKGWTGWVNKKFTGQVQGRRMDIMQKIQRDQEDNIKKLRDSDIDFDEDSIQNLALNNANVVPITGGKLISKGVRVARMRQTGTFKLDYNYIGDTSWDKGMNTCVFDYIFYKYAGKPTFIKSLPLDNREQAYDFLEGLFGQHSLTDGVCIEQIDKFCERFDVGMIALDKNEKLISYKKSIKRKYPPLIFIISNEHFYPVEDISKRTSIAAKNREADKPDEDKKLWSSEDYAFENKQGSKVGNVKYPEENEPEGNDYAVKIITQLNTLPNPQSLRVSENTITGFTIGDTTYLTERPNEEVVKFCGDNFTGQSVNSLLMETWKEVDGAENFGVGDGFGDTKDITSRVNPLVHKTFISQNVKNRTHYGTTRELGDEFFELLPAMSIKLKSYGVENTIIQNINKKCNCEKCINKTKTFTIKGKVSNKTPYKNLFTGETLYETKEKIKYHRVVFHRKTRM